MPNTFIVHKPYAPCPEYQVPDYAMARSREDGRIRRVKLSIEANWHDNIDGLCRGRKVVVYFHNASQEWVYIPRKGI